LLVYALLALSNTVVVGPPKAVDEGPDHSDLSQGVLRLWEILRRGVSMKSALISSVFFLAVAGSAFAADSASNNTNGLNNIGSNIGNGVGNGVGNGGVGNGNLTISATSAAPQAWEGYATVTASTSQCSGAGGGAGGTAPGDTYVSIFRPKIAVTDSASYLSFVLLRAALTQQNTSESTVHQMNGSGNYTGFGIGSRAGFGQYTGTYNLAITPATITASTSSVMIDGTITNFFNTTGCNVTFEGAYVARID
jgi:hypothetical protein